MKSFTQLTGAKFPIIAGPMFLVSYEKLVIAATKAGIVGGAPSLNWRPSSNFHEAVKRIKAESQGVFAINLIVNKSNPRVNDDLKVCVEEKVPIVITSLGNPKETIEKMHAVGSLVFCDVTTLEYAKKVEGLGADGVVAVSAGAGGHAGPLSPLVMIPYLAEHLSIPVIAAGGIATGRQMAAAQLLGASAVQIGTRFIASHEAKADEKYKKAILDSEPEDIVLTEKVSGTPCSVINTSYIKKMGLRMNSFETYLHKLPQTKKYMKMARAYLGSKLLENTVKSHTFKEVWSAGQGVGMIEEVLSVQEIVDKLMREFEEAKSSL